MKSKIVFLLIIIISCFCLLSAGCINSNSEKNTASSNALRADEQNPVMTNTVVQKVTSTPVKTSTPETTKTKISTPIPTKSSNPPVYISTLSLRGEYVTISNSGSSSIILTGWKIMDKAKNTYKFPPFTLNTGKSVTIYSGPQAKGGIDSGTKLYWTAKNIWNDDGDTAYLYNSAGKLIDTK